MRPQIPIAAVDARTLVPVKDEAGGVVVYIRGKAAFYVLNGEWFAALPEPTVQPSGEQNMLAGREREEVLGPFPPLGTTVSTS